MKPFASYSRRFKLNFKPKKNDFIKNLHWCCPLSAFFKAINCYINLKGVLLPNAWASQQHTYLKHGGREPVASKKWRWGKLSQISQGKLTASKYCEFSDENCE